MLWGHPLTGFRQGPGIGHFVTEPRKEIKVTPWRRSVRPGAHWWQAERTAPRLRADKRKRTQDVCFQGCSVWGVPAWRTEKGSARLREQFRGVWGAGFCSCSYCVAGEHTRRLRAGMEGHRGASLLLSGRRRSIKVGPEWAGAPDCRCLAVCPQENR